MTPTPQDVQKKGSEILKLPPVSNCFTLTMTNELVVIINSLKYHKLRKFYYMKWHFCTKLQLPPESLTRGLPPPDPRSLCPLSSTEFVEPLPKKIPGYATEQKCSLLVNALEINLTDEEWVATVVRKNVSMAPMHLHGGPVENCRTVLE